MTPIFEANTIDRRAKFNRHMTTIIGLTGNIATGKSTVMQRLAHHSTHIVDADMLTHRALRPDGAAYSSVIERFGQEIANADGTINRPALGKLVFAEGEAGQQALHDLEQIVHPAVFDLAKAEIQRAREANAPAVVIEAIKLLEAGRLRKLCDAVWVVVTDEAEQMRRLVEERSMSEADARQRISAQSSQQWKASQADVVIENSGSLDELHEQIDEAWKNVMHDV